MDMNIPNELCKSICKSLEIDMIDMTKEFRESRNFPFFGHDEHMNMFGHKLIADKIATVVKDQEGIYDCISDINNHNRYPTKYSDGTLLYQSQTENEYRINLLEVNRNDISTLWLGTNELIHPIMTKTKQYLCFTEGDQEHSETSVLLYDYYMDKKIKVSKDGFYGAIPMFSHSEEMIAYPEWKKNQSTYISIYNIKTRKYSSFVDGAECWRPIFSLDDGAVYYIQKETIDSRFQIKKYDLNTHEKSTILKSPFDIWDIALSPSGKYIAFAGNKDGNWDLFIINLENKKVNQLTKTLGDEWDPSFSVRDDELWFAGTFGFNDGIYHMNIKL